MDNNQLLIFHFPFFLEFANQNHADGNKCYADDAHQTCLFDRNTEQTVMINNERNEHLSGNNKTESERNAEARN